MSSISHHGGLVIEEPRQNLYQTDFANTIAGTDELSARQYRRAHIADIVQATSSTTILPKASLSAAAVAAASAGLAAPSREYPRLEILPLLGNLGSELYIGIGSADIQSWKLRISIRS